MIEAQTSLPADVTADGGGHMTSILTVIAGAVTGLFAWIGKAWNRKEKQVTKFADNHINNLNQLLTNQQEQYAEDNRKWQQIAMDSALAINNSNRVTEAMKKATDENTAATRELTTQSKMNQFALSRLACVQDQKKPISGTDTVQGE
jgi:hypothetical protein